MDLQKNQVVKIATEQHLRAELATTLRRLENIEMEREAHEAAEHAATMKAQFESHCGLDKDQSQQAAERPKVSVAEHNRKNQFTPAPTPVDPTLRRLGKKLAAIEQLKAKHNSASVHGSVWACHGRGH